MFTGWSRGNMDLTMLLKVIAHIKSHKNILSADALGLCDKTIKRNPDPLRLTKNLRYASLLVYAMLTGIILGEDITSFKEEHERLTRFI